MWDRKVGRLGWNALECHGSELLSVGPINRGATSSSLFGVSHEVGYSAAFLASLHQIPVTHTPFPTLYQLKMSPGILQCPLEDKTTLTWGLWKMKVYETRNRRGSYSGRIASGCDVHPSSHRSTWMRAREGHALGYWQTKGPEILRRIIGGEKKKLQALGGGNTMQNKGKGKFS